MSSKAGFLLLLSNNDLVVWRVSCSHNAQPVLDAYCPFLLFVEWWHNLAYIACEWMEDFEEQPVRQSQHLRTNQTLTQDWLRNLWGEAWYKMNVKGPLFRNGVVQDIDHRAYTKCGLCANAYAWPVPVKSALLLLSNNESSLPNVSHKAPVLGSSTGWDWLSPVHSKSLH